MKNIKLSLYLRKNWWMSIDNHCQTSNSVNVKCQTTVICQISCKVVFGLSSVKFCPQGRRHPGQQSDCHRLARGETDMAEYTRAMRRILRYGTNGTVSYGIRETNGGGGRVEQHLVGQQIL